MSTIYLHILEFLALAALVVLFAVYALRAGRLNHGLRRSEEQARAHAEAADRDGRELQAAFDRLARSETKFSRVAESAMDAIIVMDDHGRVTDCNAVTERVFGVPRDELIGDDLNHRFAPTGRLDSIAEGYGEFARTGEGPVVGRLTEVTARRGDGSEFPAELAVSGMRMDGRWHAIGILRDISQRKAAEAAAGHEQARAEHFFNIAGSLMVALDTAGRVTKINDKACGVLGLGRDQVLGSDWFDCCLPADSRDQDRKAFEQVLGNSETRRNTLRSQVVDAAGERHHVSWSLAPILGPGGRQVEGMLASGLDITREVAAERALKTSRDHFDSLVQKNRTGILIVDPEGLIQFANPAAEALMGRSSAHLEGTALGVPTVGSQSEMEIIRPGGRMGIAEMSVSETEWHGQAAYLVMLYDITERKEAEARVQHMAFHDALTGLPNRSLFNDRLHQAITRARRSGKRAAVLFMDLDRFKEVNDSLGHDTGDALLKAVAARLPECVRNSDTVARMGGDEFTVLVEDMDAEIQARLVADKIHGCLSRPFDIGGHRLIATPSIGIAIFPDSGDDAETLLRRADAAMYHAKRHKGMATSLFSPEMEVASTERLALKNDLVQALEHRQFQLHYQVKVDLATGNISGLEALLRWDHPERGRVFPDQFIPLLEDTGIIVPVGRWVMYEACRQITTWADDLGAVPSVAVNVSARQLSAGELRETVEEVLAAYPRARGRLRLELTETAVIQELDQRIPVLEALHRLDVGLDMDDFGTGYSSLSLLRRLPFDVVKLDRSFVADLETDDEARNLARAAIAMAHNLGKQVVAEGVETEGQCRILREEGCEAAQGWLFGRAVPAVDVPPEVARFRQVSPVHAVNAGAR